MDQEKIMQYQMFEQQLQMAQQNVQNLDQSLEELSKIIETLTNIDKINVGDNILVPLANGIFIEASVKNVKDLKVNVGNGTVVKKTVEDTLKMIEEQISEVEKYRHETVQFYSDIQAKLHEIQMEFMKEQESQNQQ